MELIIKPTECCYWDYEVHTARQTCNGCIPIKLEKSNLEEARCVFDNIGDRYCLIN